MNYEAAESAGFTALQPVENIVFLEAFARLGQIAPASRLTESILARDPRLCKPVLAAWERALEASSPADPAELLKPIEALRVMAECK